MINNTIKRIISALLLCSVVLSFASCASNDKPSDDQTQGENVTEAEDVQTEDQTAAETKKTPVTPKKKVKVTAYETLKMIDMSDYDQPPFVGVNEVDPLTIEDGVLVGESIGGDPFMCYAEEFNINAKDCDKIVVCMKNYSDSINNQLFFTRPDMSYCEPGSLKGTVEQAGDKWMICEYNPKECGEWSGTITGFRFDPMMSEGEFMIKYIAFYKKVTLTVEE